MTVPNSEINLGFGRRAVHAISALPLVCDTTGTTLAAMAPMPNSPVLTLPADGHQYRVTLNAVSLSVASPSAVAAVGIGTSAAILRYVKVGYCGLLNHACYLHADVTGNGQQVGVYAYSSNGTIVTVEADASCPVDLSAMLIAA